MGENGEFGVKIGWDLGGFGDKLGFWGQNLLGFGGEIGQNLGFGGQN